MSFSLDQIKKPKKKIAVVNNKPMFSWSANATNLSEKTKKIIRLYLDARIFRFGVYGLELETYKYMMKDLLKNCCGKEFVDITPEDTDQHFDEIIFQLKWALKRHKADKRTLFKHTLYMNENSETLARESKDKVIPKRVKGTDKMTEQEIEDYFEGRYI